jgi:capsular exopolysaccharide synthesis family protein
MKTVDRLNADWVLATEIHKVEARLWRQARKDGLRVVLTTSAGRGEGKSTTVAYLATALGLYPNRKILAIDLDFREPRLNSHFELEVPHSVAAVLRGECQLQNAIIKTWLPSLDLLLPSEEGENPDLLLKTQQLGALFDALRKSYDLIMMDVPALLPVADASILLPFADGVILIAMAGKTTKVQLRRAREICLGMDANLLGLIVGNLKEAMPEYLDDRYYYSYRRERRTPPATPESK